VAQKLHSQYGFSYDNLKVLLGGWNTWNQEHAKDANAYPTESSTGADTSNPAAPASGDIQATIVLQPAPANTVAPAATPKP